MGSQEQVNLFARSSASNAARGALLLCVLMLISLPAAAQGAKTSAPAQPGIFATIGHWFSQTADNFNAGMRNMRNHFHHFGQEAGDAAQSTVDTAKNAADAVGHLSEARVVAGHEKCRIAPNGAPDCVAAADAICRRKGFKNGKSVDMTTAEICPARVYLAGRNSGPGCHTLTFVSRALCQ
jgi:hypothetical protein